jgi:uncharacterized membrane protein YesL
MKFAYVNLLWILFSFLGFIFLGIGPATVALFTIVRKWLMKENDLPIFKTFFQTYKNEFIQANKLGVLMSIIGLFLYFDFKFLLLMGGTVQYMLSIPLMLITFFYLITLLYLFPVYVQFDMKLLQYIKNSFYIAVINMHITILMVAAIMLLSILLSTVPGLVPFFSMILISLVMMWGALFSFRRIERKQSLQNGGRG